MNHVIVHDCIDLMEIEKRNHRVAVVLGVEVRVPKQSTNDEIRANGPSIAKTIGLFGDLAIGMLKVAEVVNNWIAAKDGHNPPKGQIHQAIRGLPFNTKNSSVDRKLGKSRQLKGTHYTALSAVSPFLEAPAPSTVVNRDTQG